MLEESIGTEQERLNKSSKIARNGILIAAKEATMKKLKETLSKALNSFEGKGLTVTKKNGKVYVSMENKLLLILVAIQLALRVKAVVELEKFWVIIQTFRF
jgi:chemotaxis protein MotB